MPDGIRKFALIVNGDPQEERHFENVDRAVRTLKAEDPRYEIVVASARRPSVPVASYLPPDSANLKALIAGIQGKIDDDDLLVVYVTGHGDKGNEGEGCIVLPDGCLSNKVLRDQLKTLPYGKRIIVMDDCFSGGAVPLFADEKTLVVTAGSPGEKISCQNFSPFFWDEKAPDLDQDGAVTMAERYRNALDRGKLLTYSNYFSLIPSLSFSGREDRTPSFPAAVVTVTDGPQLQKELKRLQPGDLALVMFSADWCTPCHEYFPTFQKLAMTYGGRFLMIQAQGTGGSENDWAKGYQTRAFPTLLFLDEAGGQLHVPGQYFGDPEKFLMKFPLLSLSEDQKIEFILRRHGAGAFWEELIKGLKDSAPGAGNKIRSLVTGTRLPNEVFPFLAESLGRFLKDPSPLIRARAAYTVGLWGEKARTAGPLLVPMIQDADPLVRIEAVVAIVRLDFFDPPPVTVLMGEYNITASRKTGGPSWEVLRAKATSLLDHPDSFVRSRAALAMQELRTADGRSEGNGPMVYVYIPTARKVWGHYLGLSVYGGGDREGLQGGLQALYGYKWSDLWEWQVKAAAGRAEGSAPISWNKRLDFSTGPALHWASYFAPIEIVDPYVFGQAGLFYLTDEKATGVSLNAGLGVRYFLLKRKLALEAAGQAILDVSFSGDTRGGARFPLGLSYHF